MSLQDPCAWNSFLTLLLVSCPSYFTEESGCSGTGPPILWAIPLVPFFSSGIEIILRWSSQLTFWYFSIHGQHLHIFPHLWFSYVVERAVSCPSWSWENIQTFIYSPVLPKWEIQGGYWIPGFWVSEKTSILGQTYAVVSLQKNHRMNVIRENVALQMHGNLSAD